VAVRGSVNGQEERMENDQSQAKVIVLPVGSVATITPEEKIEELEDRVRDLLWEVEDLQEKVEQYERWLGDEVPHHLYGWHTVSDLIAAAARAAVTRPIESWSTEEQRAVRDALHRRGCER
jgi:hypothetical protein